MVVTWRIVVFSPSVKIHAIPSDFEIEGYNEKINSRTF